MASNNSVNLAKHVDTSKITFEGPLANNYGGKYAKVFHKGSWLLVQTTRMLSPFGVNVYEENDSKGHPTGKKSYSVDVSFNGYRPDPESDSAEANKPKVKELYDMITSMEDKLVTHASNNSFTWVDNPDASKDVCRALLRSGVKFSRDKDTKQISTKYAPRLKFNLPVWEDGMGFKAYVDSSDNEITDIESLVRIASGKCEVQVIAKCDKVTFNGGKYGFKWSVQQLKIYTSASSMSSYAFIEDSDEDEDDNGTDDVQQAKAHFVEDSDEESEDELDNHALGGGDDDDEEEAPPVTKKRVVKKK